MPKEKYRKDIMLLFEKSPVVSYNSIKRLVRSKKKTRQYIKKIVHDLLSKNKIKRLTKGYYTIRDDVSLAVFAFQPAYLGLQDALSFYNFWEQETIPIIVTIKKIRQGIREIFGQNVLIRRIKKKYFFGIKDYHYEDVALPYSDIEKTFIDMIYFRQPLDEETKKNIIKNLNRKKLNLYLKKYPRRFKDKVLSFIKTS